MCATDSSSTCPAWPVCYADQVGPDLAPGWLENPIIEFVHRFISFSGLVLLGVSGCLGRRSPTPGCASSRGSRSAARSGRPCSG
ncbi:hypothetical protein G7085_08875 [Tessaracoccus sp. HDW20]|uniref:hypothetical protein n=1 Tax=Tessaracoccus coleopterorum TaxID=2714950 RepID=UPI0018D3F12D|nr:hypothetical protein [Tessaracoccus coleopterorum]NHB84684.1 hypothetical protein [Tessaracoccus coleopterorum]